MNIKYENITLRAIEEDDLNLLREMMNDGEIEKMIGGFSFPVSKYQQQKWFTSLCGSQNEFRVMIEVKSYGAIGTIILTDIDWKNKTAQIHCKIVSSEKIRGNGYGTRAIKLLTNYSFVQLNIECVYCNILEENYASKRAFEKAGYSKEGLLRKRVYKNGKYHNVEVWSILKGELLE